MKFPKSKKCNETIFFYPEKEDPVKGFLLVNQKLIFSWAKHPKKKGTEIQMQIINWSIKIILCNNKINTR